MDPSLIFVATGVLICVVDFALGIYLGRCVIPGLKCEACKKAGTHEPDIRRDPNA